MQEIEFPGEIRWLVSILHLFQCLHPLQFSPPRKVTLHLAMLFVLANKMRQKWQHAYTLWSLFMLPSASSAVAITMRRMCLGSERRKVRYPDRCCRSWRALAQPSLMQSPAQPTVTCSRPLLPAQRDRQGSGWSKAAWATVISIVLSHWALGVFVTHQLLTYIGKWLSGTSKFFLQFSFHVSMFPQVRMEYTGRTHGHLWKALDHTGGADSPSPVLH